MRLALLLGAAALATAAPASAQQAGPAPTSTYVQPHHAGEALRVTTYAERPSGPGRLAARYRGLRANRSVHAPQGAHRTRVVSRTVETPRGTFIRQGGSFFQVVPTE